MTQRDVINAVYGYEKWMEMPSRDKELIYPLLFWMKKNYGVLPEEPSRDRLLLSCIQIACLEVWDMPYEEIMSRTRKREYVDRRYIIMSIARDISCSTPADFARLFPEYDRCTINNHAIQVAEVYRDTDQEFRKQYDAFYNTTIKHLKEIHLL